MQLAFADSKCGLDYSSEVEFSFSSKISASCVHATNGQLPRNSPILNPYFIATERTFVLWFRSDIRKHQKAWHCLIRLGCRRPFSRMMVKSKTVKMLPESFRENSKRLVIGVTRWLYQLIGKMKITEEFVCCVLPKVLASNTLCCFYTTHQKCMRENQACFRPR